MFLDLKIASLMGDRERIGREFMGDAWMAYLHEAAEIPFIPRLRENQYGGREGDTTWPIAALARHLNKDETNDPQRRLPARAKRAGVIATHTARDHADRRGRTVGAGRFQQAIGTCL